MARNKSIAVGDCETLPFKVNRVPRPFVWGFYDGSVYQQFPFSGAMPGPRGWDANTKTIVEHGRELALVPAKGVTIESMNIPTIHAGIIAHYVNKSFVDYIRELPIVLYAHNGGKFDWHFILPYLNAYDKVMLINGRIAQCYIGMCELRDSYNILPIPLRAYKKDDIDYALMEADQRYKPDNWREISKYLKSDCVYLHELISGFIGKYGLHITQAAASMHQWKHISQRPTPQTNKEFYDLISPYYYGGRVECFESGIIDTEFKVVDINSAYPRAMLENHPYSPNFTQIAGFMDGADFYKVECKSKGAFPYRGEGRPDEFAGLRFPNDDKLRIYTITKWEYAAALETNAVSDMRVLESIAFDDHVHFGDYINHFYEMRLQAKAAGNDAESLFAKLLMNSLYGKFAANPENYRDYIIVPMDVLEGLEAEGWEFAGEMGCWGLAQRPLDEHQQRYYNVATGASITGYVRAMLWRAIAGSKGVLYCDTDSIAVRRAGATLTFGDKLGEWKHEGDFDRAGIGGKKLYIFRGVPDSKGNRVYKTASKGARLTHSQLWDIAKGGTVQFISDVPTFSPIKPPHFVKRRIQYTARKTKGNNV